MRDKTKWLELCVSMDVIEDTYLACEAYKSLRETKDKGTIYLVIYGVMQCLFVQQDALQSLCEAVAYPFRIRDVSVFKDARRFRNVSVGHPVNSKRADRDFPHNFMIQVRMTPSSFDLHSHGKEKTRLSKVELAKLVGQQEREVRGVLQKVVIAMKEREIEHRKKFRSKKLVDVIRQSDYPMQKVFEAAWNEENYERGAAMLRPIEEAVNALVNALKERDIEISSYHGIDDALKKMTYPLGRLEGTFSRKENNDPALVEILADYIARKLDTLKEGARIIDDEYASDTL
jgi:hypothetical protein